MACRNAAVALFGIALCGGGFWLKVHLSGNGAETYWWIWAAIAAFVVAVAILHALLASWFGVHRATAFLKVVVVFALAGMLFGVWWYLRPKDGG